MTFDDDQRAQLADLWERRDFDGILTLFSSVGVIPLAIYRAGIEEDPEAAERDAEHYVRQILDAEPDTPSGYAEKQAKRRHRGGSRGR